MYSLATTAKLWCVLIGMKHKPAVKVSQGYESSCEYELVAILNRIRVNAIVNRFT